VAAKTAEIAVGTVKRLTDEIEKKAQHGVVRLQSG
jgi:hypothetical protein